MSDLDRLPNIGTSLAGELSDAGIETPEQLHRLGSVRAALRLVGAGRTVCANKLYALEGAIRGVRWHAIPRDERSELRARFERASNDESGS